MYDSWMRDQDAVAGIARAFADETRVRLIEELSAGEATVSDLAARLRLEQPRVSTHLAVLRAAGLVEARADGRQRAYALRGRAPALVLATLRTLAGRAPGAGPERPAASREAGRDVLVRRARTCYDHLAGVAGVDLLDGLLARGWVEPAGARDLLLTEPGAEALGRAGVDVDAACRSRRAFAIRCPDWTERRPHLGGALGASLLTAMLHQGRARLRPGDRAVHLEVGEPVRFLQQGDPGLPTTG